MQQKNNTAILGIVAVVVIGAIVAGTILLKPKNKSSSDSTMTNDSSQTTTDAATYKDGTYTAQGSYTSPGGNEEISVTITISGGKVANSSATPKAASAESHEYQQDFVDNYKAQVTGKSISGLRLSHVAGSSLTSMGFNEALDAIRNQAQS
jgi:uncharacterized protein with FMN-binding domain